MELLETQAQFEAFWFDTVTATEMANTTTQKIIYFTAEWCKACKALDCDAIIAAAAEANIPILKCDATINDYTAGYCGVSKFPTFLHIAPKSILSRLSSNKTAEVVDWIRQRASAGAGAGATTVTATATAPAK
jgi:hypothetical protein